MGNFFHSPRKVTGQNLDKFKVPCKCDRSDYKYQPVTAEGELTLEGVYEQFLLDMQNDRHWAKSTCIAYDREFWRSVAPIFRGIPYADLNEELAEKLWMGRGQHIFLPSSLRGAKRPLPCKFLFPSPYSLSS